MMSIMKTRWNCGRNNSQGDHNRSHRETRIPNSKLEILFESQSPSGYLKKGTCLTGQMSLSVTKVIQTLKVDAAFAGPLQYKIKDYNNEEIQGAFYGFELQKIQPPDRYRVEEVLRERVVRGQRQYFVKWMGYGAEFNSWVTDIENI